MNNSSPAAKRSRRSLELRAIIIALILFIVLHIVLLLVARSASGSPERLAAVVPTLNVAAYFLYLIVGFAAGVAARNANVLHGVVAGFLAAIIALVFFRSEQRDLVSILVVVANGMIFGGIGGTFSLLLSRDN